MGKLEIAAFSGITLAIICFLLCILSVSISETAIGFMYPNADNDACISKRDVSFGLAKWLAVGGLSNIVVSIVGAIMVFCAVGCGTAFDDNDCAFISASMSGGLGLCLLILYGLFSLAWFVVGCVIIGAVPNDCKNDYYPVWAMTIASLVFRGLTILSSCCARRAKQQSEN